MIRVINFLFYIVISFLSAGAFAYSRAEPAIDGYDAVAYFTTGRATVGSDEFSWEWQGKSWWFADEKHLSLFQAAPERYAPEYQGYCANGLSDGHLIKANPEIFRVIDGRLYMFYSWWGRAQWKFKQQEQIEQAHFWWKEFNRTEVTTPY